MLRTTTTFQFIAFINLFSRICGAVLPFLLHWDYLSGIRARVKGRIKITVRDWRLGLGLGFRGVQFSKAS